MHLHSRLCALLRTHAAPALLAAAAMLLPARALAAGALPTDVLALSASRPDAQLTIDMLWYAGDAHSRALFDWYRRHVADLDAIGLAVAWIPLPQSDMAGIDSSCLASIAGFTQCNAPNYQPSSNDGFDRLVQNYQAFAPFAQAHGLRGLWAIWDSPRGWTGSASVLAGQDGSVDGAATFGRYLRKLGLADETALIASMHTVRQPGVDGPQLLYIFWDPDCAYCHRDFLRISDEAAAIHARNPKLGIRWVPVGVLRPGSRVKAARALAGYAAMQRDEQQYNDDRESGGLAASGAVAPALAADESENRLAYAALTGGGGTPSFLWTGGGHASVLPGSPPGLMAFLAGLH